MRRNTLLIAAIVALSPVALCAVAPPAANPGQAREDALFKRLDTNGDGVITQEEAQAAGARHILEAFDKLDLNHDGMITRDELHEAHLARRAEMEARFASRFAAADKNGDGTLSREEVQQAMPRVARHFDEIDTNQDGQISQEELKAARHLLGMHHGHRQPSPGAPASDGQVSEPVKS